MTNSNDLDLGDVLNEYAACPGGPSYSNLVEWARRYPELAQELAEFTVAWVLQDALPPAPDAEEVDDETLVRRGMVVVRQVLSGFGTSRAFG